MNELCAERSKPATETLKKNTVNDNGIDFYHIRRLKKSIFDEEATFSTLKTQLNRFAVRKHNIGDDDDDENNETNFSAIQRHFGHFYSWNNVPGFADQPKLLFEANFVLLI